MCTHTHTHAHKTITASAEASHNTHTADGVDCTASDLLYILIVSVIVAVLLLSTLPSLSLLLLCRCTPDTGEYRESSHTQSCTSELIITTCICCWTVCENYISTLHGRTQCKSDQASAKPDLTFSNVDI